MPKFGHLIETSLMQVERGQLHAISESLQAAKSIKQATLRERRADAISPPSGTTEKHRSKAGSDGTEARSVKGTANGGIDYLQPPWVALVCGDA